MRALPVHDIKGGDLVADGREVFDVRSTFGRKVAVLFTDGTRLEVQPTATVRIAN